MNNSKIFHMARLFLVAVIVCLFASTARAQDEPGVLKFRTAQDSQDSLIRAANKASTTLTASLSAIATTATVASTGTFPVTGVILFSGTEYVSYTSKDTTHFYGLVRGKDGTIAISHSINASVGLVVAALFHNTLASAVLSLETAVGGDAWGASQIPRLTTSQRNALVSPVAGWKIWNTTAAQEETYNGSSWIASLVDNDLSVIAALSGTGILTRTATDTWALRSVVDAGSGRIGIANPAGISGNMTLDVNGAALTKTDDTNVTLTLGGSPTTALVNSASITVGWAGTLAKNRQNAATVYNDQANVFGNFAQTFQAGANHLLVDPIDTTKKFQFDVSNVATGTTRTVNIPNANSTPVQPDTGASNQFLTAISAQGVISKAQPAFSNISGTATAGQLPIAAADGSTKGVASFTTADFDASSGNISLDYTNAQKATGSVPGLLSAADWTTFNAKVSTSRILTAGTGLTGGGDLSADRTFNLDLTYSHIWTGIDTWTPGTRSSGSAAYMTVNAPADTGQTASTESPGIKWIGADRRHATGALTTQREWWFGSPTYSFVGASTVTEVATVAIDGPPILGSNATFTSSFGLWVGNATDHQAVPNQVSPFRGGIISGANYTNNGTGNNFQIVGWGITSGTVPTVGVGGFANTTGANGYVAGGNFVGYVNTASTANAHGLEVDTGRLVASPSSSAISILSVTYGGNGASAHLWMQTGAALSEADNGIVFAKTGGLQPVNSSGWLLTTAGAPSVGGGIDLSGAGFSDSPFKIPNNTFLKALNASSVSKILIGIDASNINTLQSGGSGWRFLNSAGGSNVVNISDTGVITGAVWNAGIIPLAYGGSNANLTASNGGIVYSTASAFGILSGTATAGQILRSGASAAPTWSTATYPATAGTSGNVLKSDGTNWGSTAIGQADVANLGWVLISTQAASSSATIDFTGLDNTYDSYVLVVNGARPATDDKELWLRVQTGGSTWQTSGYKWSITEMRSDSAPTSEFNNSDAKIRLTQGSGITVAVGNTSGYGWSGEIKFQSPAASNFMETWFDAQYSASASTISMRVLGGGRYSTVGAITGLRFLFDAGNIAVGQFTLYGRRKT